MYSISNNELTIQVSAKGAELQSIYNNQSKLEYLWSGNAAYWAKKSPVLFPVVGNLKNNRYSHIGKEFELGRHGFARDSNFELAEQTETSVSFFIRGDEKTKEIYPFNFLFVVQYTLLGSKLVVTFTVENTGVPDLLFSVGAHPAFAVPIVDGTEYKDYSLQFDKNEIASRWPISDEGLINTEPIPFIDNQNKLQLKKELFYEDAIVFKNLESNSISIVSDKTPHGVRVEFNDFPYMGIWAAKDADFVCIEPWCGIADSVNTTGNLEEKEGIITLPQNEQFIRTYSIEVF